MPPPIDDTPRRQRATRMTPEARRRAIIEATIPLVREHGYAVTTRQIAEAAQVAEGTLFRAFDDKNQLIHEAICAVLEPTGLDARIEAIDRHLPLRDRLVRATELVQQRLLDVFELFAAVQLTQPPGGGRVTPPNHDEFSRAIERLIERDAENLRLPPVEVTALLRALTFAGSHAGLGGGRTLTADEIVAVLLDGVTNHHSHSTGDSSC